MPTIGEMEYGFTTKGVESYLEEIKSIVLIEASDKVKDISAIKDVCGEKWAGDAAYKFVENIQRDANKVAEEYLKLQQLLAREIVAVAAAMKDKDKNLIK